MVNSLEQEVRGLRQMLSDFITKQERPQQEVPKGDELYGSSYARTPRTYENVRPQPYLGTTSKMAPPTKAVPQPREFIPETAETPKQEKAVTLSPAYRNPEANIWEQSYLSKALQQMKDSEIAKLRFVSGGNRPFEFEKWLHLIP